MVINDFVKLLSEKVSLTARVIKLVDEGGSELVSREVIAPIVLDTVDVVRTCFSRLSLSAA